MEENKEAVSSATYSAPKNTVYVSEKTGATTRNPTFRIAEAYRMIRTNLLFTLANTDNRVVVFSSAEPSAGKSTLCSNLAIVMAQTGAKVVLVDADMRKPVQHTNFRVSKTNGLSKILGGLNTLEECTVKQVMPNLDLIPSGSIPPNPSELLGSDRMKKLMKTLGETYDYVFIDTPPLGVVADALVLAPETAGVALVVRQGQTTYDEVRECIDGIRQIGANLLGAIITDVHNEGVGYGRYGRYGRYGKYGRYGRYGKQYYRSYDYRYGGRVGKDD